MNKHEIAGVVAKGDYSLFNEELVSAVREALIIGKVSLIIDLLAVANAVGRRDTFQQMHARLTMQFDEAERTVRYHTTIGE